MKRCISILLMITICMTFIACSNQPTTQPSSTDSELNSSAAPVETSDTDENDKKDDNTPTPTETIPVSSSSLDSESSETTPPATKKKDPVDTPSKSAQPTAPPKETESPTPNEQTETPKQTETPIPSEPPVETIKPAVPPEAEETKQTEQPKVATEDDCKAIADKIIEYINSYRSGSATKLLGLTGYAEYRSRQIVRNFAHDTNDQRTAATTLQYGEYVDPPLYGMSGDPYYTVNAREAIAKAGYYGTVDYVAEQLTLQYKNSASHWSYISDTKYQYIAVGVTYQNGTWYCAVVLTQSNTDNN